MISRHDTRALSFARPCFFVALATLPCCTPLTQAEKVDDKAMKIVQQRAQRSFGTFIDDANSGALQTFLDMTESAKSRNDLVSAWQSLPILRLESENFLQEYVFGQAIRDPGWPAEADEWVFVQGTREGLRKVLFDEG